MRLPKGALQVIGFERHVSCGNIWNMESAELLNPVGPRNTQRSTAAPRPLLVIRGSSDVQTPVQSQSQRSKVQASINYLTEWPTMSVRIRLTVSFGPVAYKPRASSWLLDEIQYGK
jgi:hypothetical protein